MSLEADLTAVLSPLAGGRVYPDFAPDNAARPYIVYQQVGGPSPNYLEKAVPDGRGARMQVACWADTRLAASALALQVEDALVQATAFDTESAGALVATADPDTRLRGARQDFLIWAAR